MLPNFELWTKLFEHERRSWHIGLKFFYRSLGLKLTGLGAIVAPSCCFRRLNTFSVKLLNCPDLNSTRRSKFALHSKFRKQESCRNFYKLQVFFLKFGQIPNQIGFIQV